MITPKIKRLTIKSQISPPFSSVWLNYGASTFLSKNAFLSKILSYYGAQTCHVNIPDFLTPTLLKPRILPITNMCLLVVTRHTLIKQFSDFWLFFKALSFLTFSFYYKRPCICACLSSFKNCQNFYLKKKKSRTCRIKVGVVKQCSNRWHWFCFRWYTRMLITHLPVRTSK